MAAGIQVWDASGNLIVDTTTRLGRVLGSFTIGTGSDPSSPISNAKLSEGTPWFYAIPVAQSVYDGYEADITISSSQISWSWPSAYRNETFILYGVY